MSDARRRRLDAARGVAFVVLVTLALALPGQPPRADDTLEKVMAVLVDRGPFQFGGPIDVGGRSRRSCGSSLSAS